MTKNKKSKKSSHKSPILRVLTPSWPSGLSVFVLAAAATAVMIIIFMTNAGTLQQDLIQWHPSEPPKALTLPGEELPSVDQPTLLGSWPLIVIWALIGLLLYALASYIVHTFVRAAHFKSTYTYVSALPHDVMEALVRQLELRTIAFLILIGLGYLMATELVPYCVLLARASSADVGSVSGIAYALACLLIFTISLHVLTIFSRLSLGRTRVFS